MKPESMPVVLIVDDSPTSVAALASCITEFCRVKVATNGQDALNVMAGEPQPDLALVDVNMPLVDGFELCRQAKADPGIADIPVIFVTGRDSPQDEERGLTLGAIDYIHKPPTPALVRARVRNHLELKSARDLLRTIATRDQLTGLPNRREFDERLSNECARAARSGSPLAVAMLDLDHFKDYNDTHGHLAGDEALKRFARLLLAELREGGDHPYRWGGEEFALLVAGTDGSGAVTVLERLRSAHLPGDLTFSAGVAVLDPDDPVAPDELVLRADRALYLAKNSGRDQIRLWEQVPDGDVASDSVHAPTVEGQVPQQHSPRAESGTLPR